VKRTGVMTGGILVLGLALAGCGGARKLSLEARFDQVRVGQSRAEEVLALFEDQPVLQTPEAISVAVEQRWGGEVGIIEFSPVDATVRRKEYFRQRSVQPAPLMTREETYLRMQGICPKELLEQPYENELRQHVAILEYFLESLKGDVRAFVEDAETESLMGLARTALETGIRALSRHPRRGSELTAPKGFLYEHPTLGNCRLQLTDEGNNIYSVRLGSGVWADPLVGW